MMLKLKRMKYVLPVCISKDMLYVPPIIRADIKVDRCW